MPPKTTLAHCPFRNTEVNLELGLRRCIEARQCFSDEPCPLGDKFLQAHTTAAHKKATMPAKAPILKQARL